jgi:rhodanese-related sulfurtransferase
MAAPATLIFIARRAASALLFVLCAVAAVRTGGGDDSRVVVDVRPPDDYLRAHIPGSQNTPLFALKTLTHLKERGLTVVGPAAPSPALEREVARLAETGWNIRLLEGGLATWSARGRPLDGTATDRRELNRVSVEDFLAAQDRNWRVIDLDDNPPPAEADRPTARRSARLGRGVRSFRAQVRAALDAGPAEAPVLVVNEFGRYDAVEPVLEGGFPATPFLYLKGGWSAYDAFVATARERRASAGCVGAGCPRAARGCSSCR